MAQIDIQETTIKEAFEAHKLIPEFIPNPPFALEEFKNQIKLAKYLCLVAYVDDQLAGYSLGYDAFNDGSFYSWLGGVLPQHRKLGVYRKLREYQENWAKKQGYTSIKIKTWNRRIEMRIVLAKLGYNLIGIEKKPNVLDNRLMHQKQL